MQMNFKISSPFHREKAGIYPLLDVDDMVSLTFYNLNRRRRLNIVVFLPFSRSHMQSQIGNVCSATCNRFIVDSRMKIECLIFFSFFIYLHYLTDFVVIFSTKARVFSLAYTQKSTHITNVSICSL